jgi:SAM-dependent methyltransferase
VLGDRGPDLFYGFFAVPALAFFGELGVADRWIAGEAVDLDALCAERRLDAALVRSLADYLTAGGVLERDGANVKAGAAGAQLHAWPATMLFYSYLPLLGALLPLADGTKKYGHGADVYRDMYFDTRASGIRGARSGLFDRVTRHLRTQRNRKVLDLGCGDGSFLAHACRTIDTLQAIGVDQSEVAVAAARHMFETRGLAARGTFLQGDLRTPERFIHAPELAGVDAATMFFVLHELTYDESEPAVRMLRDFSAAFGRRTTLLVTEIYRPPEQAGRDAAAGERELVLVHDLSKQGVMSRDAWFAVYDRAGFDVVGTLERAHRGRAPFVGTAVLRAR